MNRLSHPAVLWFALVPACALLVLLWLVTGAMQRREHALRSEAAALRADLNGDGVGMDADRLAEMTEALAGEAARLRTIAEEGFALAREPLVLDHEGMAFQLIEFERERAAAAQQAREAAAAASVKVAESAFEVVADGGTAAQDPAPLWAQLALAKAGVLRAALARVESYEALPAPEVREIRVDPSSPVLARQVFFAARVQGTGNSVQAFLERLVFGNGGDSPRLHIEHLLLRKEGVESTDRASATVVFSGFLPPGVEREVQP